ncbi:Putative chemotaxis protein CheYIII [Magnetospira sp. QH-2]|nr:Putative chemotaxis protein CheYIII [Magnetospira sp. QH-2]
MVDGNLQGLNILIVEDNIHFRTLLTTILKHGGVSEIREVDNGDDALEVLQGFNADLAIVDWKMEGMDGLECVRRIRRDTPLEAEWRKIPVLMVSSKAGGTLPAMARDAGVNDLLPKPISPRTLIGALIEVLERPTAFIDSSAYVGPDRRRIQQDFGGMEKRTESLSV